MFTIFILYIYRILFINILKKSYNFGIIIKLSKNERNVTSEELAKYSFTFDKNDFDSSIFFLLSKIIPLLKLLKFLLLTSTG